MTHLLSRSRRSLTLAVLLVLTACASPSVNDEVVPFENSGNLETVVLLGTNDIHGALAPARLKTKDPNPIEYEKGGIEYFASHVGILRRQYGDHLILLDGGDQFQGSIDSNLEEGRPMVRALNQLGYAASAIGNHEFDFGPEGSFGAYDPVKMRGQDVRGTLKARIGEAKYPYLAANIFSKKGGTFPGIPGTQASTLIRAGRLKIGIIGLTTLETPVKTRATNVSDLEFRDMAKTAIAEAKRLRDDGANLVVVLTHAGVFCTIPMAADRAPRPGLLRAEGDFQTGCESNQEIPELLRRVPKGTIDAVISGHTHTLVHHWIEGVPVIQAGTQSVYYNLIYLTYDWTKRALRTDKTRIEGPIPICPKIFANQGNCNGDQPASEKGRGDLVTAKLRGVEIQADSAMAATLAPTFARTNARKREVVGKAARPVGYSRVAESPLVYFVADALRDAVGAQIGIMNTGGARGPWESGDITYADVFRTLPFDNQVSKLTLTGKELRRLIRITHSGAQAFFPTSGLIVRVIRREDEPYASDLDGNGRIEPWELDRLIDVTLADGSPIEDGKTYTVALSDFLVSGGDSLGWFMGGLPKDRIVRDAGGDVRDAVATYLKKRTAAEPGGINSDANPILDPAKPRLILEKRTEKKQRQKSNARPRKKRRR